MVVDLAIIIIPDVKCCHLQRRSHLRVIPEGVHVGVDKNFYEGKKEVEDEPNVDHLDVGRFG